MCDVNVHVYSAKLLHFYAVYKVFYYINIISHISLKYMDGTTLAISSSAGTTPCSKDRLIKCAKASILLSYIAFTATGVCSSHPALHYAEGLTAAALPSHKERRLRLCHNLFTQLLCDTHKLHQHLPKEKTMAYGLRSPQMYAMSTCHTSPLRPHLTFHVLCCTVMSVV